MQRDYTELGYIAGTKTRQAILSLESIGHKNITDSLTPPLLTRLSATLTLSLTPLLLILRPS